MKTKLLAMALMAGSTMFAGVRFGVGIGIPAPVAVVQTPGYYGAPPFVGAYWIAPRWEGGRYYAGYWGGHRVDRDDFRRGYVDRNHHDDHRGFRR